MGREKLRGIVLVVNDAGSDLLRAVEEAIDEEVKRNYETNVFGLLKVTRTVLPHMRRQRSGFYAACAMTRANPPFSAISAPKLSITDLDTSQPAWVTPRAYVVSTS